MIRSVERRDIPRICEIYNHYVLNTSITFEEQPVSPEDMEKRVSDYTAALPWLVYEEDSAILGYCYATKWRARSAYRHSAETTVYVDKNYLRRGIGLALYESLIEQTRARDIHVLVAGISLPNESSQKIHERLGFKKVAHFGEIGMKFGRWIDVGYWEYTYR